jgi:hypothetical protein
MAIEGSESLPQTRAIQPELPHVHLTVHVHLDERARTPSRRDEERDEKPRESFGRELRDGAKPGDKREGGLSARPVLTAVLAAGAVFLVGSIGYRMGNHGGESAAREGVAVAVRSDPVAPIAGKVPAEIEETLREPPRVIPPPGGGAARRAKTGPAAFGLSE